MYILFSSNKSYSLATNLRFLEDRRDVGTGATNKKGGEWEEQELICHKE